MKDQLRLSINLFKELLNYKKLKKKNMRMKMINLLKRTLLLLKKKETMNMTCKLQQQSFWEHFSRLTHRWYLKLFKLWGRKLLLKHSVAMYKKEWNSVYSFMMTLLSILDPITSHQKIINKSWQLFVALLTIKVQVYVKLLLMESV